MHLWPAFPPEGEFAAAWFTPAQHLLTCAAGWPRLDLGASWWHSAGYPVDEPVFALVNDMLGDRRDELIAWLLTSMTPGNLPSAIAEATGTSLPTATRPNLDMEWLNSVNHKVTTWSAYAPGQGDPLDVDSGETAVGTESFWPPRAEEFLADVSGQHDWGLLWWLSRGPFLQRLASVDQRSDLAVGSTSAGLTK